MEDRSTKRGAEINLILASAEQLEQITPIIQERCEQELCGPVALWVSEGALALTNVCVLLVLCVCVCRGKGLGRGKEVY